MHLLLSVLLPFGIIKNDYRNYQSSLILVLAYEAETVIECHEELTLISFFFLDEMTL